MLWSTVSKAAVRSKRMSRDGESVSAAIRRSLVLKVQGQGICFDVFQISEMDLSLRFGVGGRKGQLH